MVKQTIFTQSEYFGLYNGFAMSGYLLLQSILLVFNVSVFLITSLVTHFHLIFII